MKEYLLVEVDATLEPESEPGFGCWFLPAVMISLLVWLSACGFWLFVWRLL